MSEDKIQHTDALSLCHRLSSLHSAASGLQHELVFHYSAPGFQTRRTKASVERLSRQMEKVEEELDAIRAELEGLER